MCVSVWTELEYERFRVSVTVVWTGIVYEHLPFKAHCEMFLQLGV